MWLCYNSVMRRSFLFPSFTLSFFFLFRVSFYCLPFPLLPSSLLWFWLSRHGSVSLSVGPHLVCLLFVIGGAMRVVFVFPFEIFS